MFFSKETKPSPYKIIIAVIVVIILALLAVFIIDTIKNDPFNSASPNYYYKDRIIYPLEEVNVDDNSEYILTRWQHSPVEKFEIVTDTKMIKDNVSTFCIENDGKIYGTTAGGVITLYKDGKDISIELYDEHLTRKVEYGTLVFTEVNELQYMLLLGGEIIKQEEYYSIVSVDDQGEPYYYFFAHGNNLESLDTVYRLEADSDLDKLPTPQEVAGNILEFTNNKYEHGNDWRLNLSDFTLS